MTLQEHTKRGFRKGNTLIKYINESIYDSVEDALASYLEDIKNPLLPDYLIADYQGTIDAFKKHLNNE